MLTIVVPVESCSRAGGDRAAAGRKREGGGGKGNRKQPMQLGQAVVRNRTYMCAVFGVQILKFSNSPIECELALTASGDR